MMKFRTLLVSGSALVALGGAVPAFAQAADSAPATPPPPQTPSTQAAATSQAPQTDGSSTAGAPTQTRDLGDIVVTARRRAENIQRVPVSVQAFSAQTLITKNITNTQQLQKITPGVVFIGAGTESNTALAIRGQGRSVVGPGLPSVILYLNEVPLPSYGSVLPTYDVSNVQVLKGPQGTLFGRNTTGGAVLIYTAAPTYKTEGYFQGILGDYFWHEAEGAINLPIVEDKIALRVAGRFEQRDGYTKTAGRDQDDLNSRSGRVSLLLQPTDWLKNVTVGDYYHKNTGNAGVQAVGSSEDPNVVTSTSPALYNLGSAAFGPQLGPLIDAFFNCKVSAACDVDLAIAAQKADGPRRSTIDSPHFDHTTIYGVSNTTTATLGNLTIKNIFGYRRTHYNQKNDTDGTGLVVLDTISRHDDRQISDELQFSGDLNVFDRKLTYIFGAFYLKDTPLGSGTGLALDFLRPPIISQSTPFIGTVSNSLYSDRSEAVFGSLTYEILPGLKLNGGYRFTKDKEGTCAVTFQPITTPFIHGLSDCHSFAGTPGYFNGSAKFSASTFSAGADYQVTSDIFTYGVVRRGYRAGGLNAPLLGGTLTPFQSYKPQTITDVELGTKVNFRLGDLRGRINVDVFRGKFKDLQRQLTAVPPNIDGDNNPLDDPASTSLTINGASSRVQGFEADAVVSPVEALTFTAGVSYLDAKYLKVNTPAALANVPGALLTFDATPKWSYTASGRYKLPFELDGARFFLNSDVYHIDNYTIGLAKVPGYTLVGASFDIENIGHTPFSMSVFVTNITNKLYYTNSSLSGASPGPISFTFGEPRMFGVRGRYNF